MRRFGCEMCFLKVRVRLRLVCKFSAGVRGSKDLVNMANIVSIAIYWCVFVYLYIENIFLAATFMFEILYL